MTAGLCLAVLALSLAPAVAEAAPFRALAFAALTLGSADVAWRLASRWLGDAAPSVFLLGVGLAWQALAALLVAWTGIVGAFELPVIAALLAVLCFGSRALGPARRPAALLAGLPFGRGHRFGAVVLVAFAALAWAVVAGNQLRYTVQDADSMWYHLVLPAEQVRTGSIWALDAVPTMAQGYPGFRQASVALASLPWGHEHLALLAVLEFPLLLLATYVLARQLAASRALALAAGVAAATTPVAMAGLSTQGNDVALAVYLCAATAFCLRAFAPGDAARRHRSGDAWFAGIALGALAACKFSGPGYAALVLLTALAQAAGRHTWSWRGLAPLLAGPLVLALPWYLRNLVAFGNPLWPARLEAFGVAFDGPVSKELLSAQTLGWDVAPLLEHLGFFVDAHGVSAPVAGFGFALGALAVATGRLRWRRALVVVLLPVLLFVTFLHHPFNLPRFDAGYSHRYLIAWFSVCLAATAVALTVLVPAAGRLVVELGFAAAAAAGVATVTRLSWPLASLAVLLALATRSPAVRRRLEAFGAALWARRVPTALGIGLCAVVAFGVARQRAIWQYDPALGWRDGSSERGWGPCVAFVHREVRDARVGLCGSHFLFPLLGEPWSNAVRLADQPLLGAAPKTVAEVLQWIDAERLDWLVCCRDRRRDPESGAWVFLESIAAALQAARPGAFEVAFAHDGAHVLRVAR